MFGFAISRQKGVGRKISSEGVGQRKRFLAEARKIALLSLVQGIQRKKNTVK